VWSLPTAEANRVKRLTDDEFKHELNNAFQLMTVPRSAAPFPFKLAETFLRSSALQNMPPLPPLIASIESPRLSFPLQFQQAKSYTGPRVVLLGDAAHSIHPQAGQGLNLGIQDAEVLATVVSEGLAVGQDIGSRQLLQRYGDQQYLANVLMMGSVDTVHKLFTSDIGPVANLRALGLRAINNSEFLKANMAKFAMGS
jgi:ubiquinone biosynthesis monooxygenase Coq6